VTSLWGTLPSVALYAVTKLIVFAEISRSQLILLYFFFFVVLGLEFRAFTLSHSTSPTFCDRVCQDSISQTICLGWLQRITGMSHQPYFFLKSAFLGWSWSNLVHSKFSIKLQSLKAKPAVFYLPWDQILGYNLSNYLIETHSPKRYIWIQGKMFTYDLIHVLFLNWFWTQMGKTVSSPGKFPNPHATSLP
jgi:hypothetical protein